MVGGRRDAAQRTATGEYDIRDHRGDQSRSAPFRSANDPRRSPVGCEPTGRIVIDVGCDPGGPWKERRRCGARRCGRPATECRSTASIRAKSPPRPTPAPSSCCRSTRPTAMPRPTGAARWWSSPTTSPPSADSTGRSSTSSGTTSRFVWIPVLEPIGMGLAPPAFGALCWKIRRRYPAGRDDDGHRQPHGADRCGFGRRMNVLLLGSLPGARHSKRAHHAGHQLGPQRACKECDLARRLVNYAVNSGVDSQAPRTPAW